MTKLAAAAARTRLVRPVAVTPKPAKKAAMTVGVCDAGGQNEQQYCG